MDELRRRIADGTYPVGVKLPSETELIAEFGTSRPTVVRALNDMATLGEVEREHGRGTFVRPPSARSHSPRNRPGLAVLDREENSSSVRLLNVSRTQAPAGISELLGIASSAPAHIRQYVSLFDGEVSELVSLWTSIDIARSAGLDNEKPLLLSVRTLLIKATGERISHIAERIAARRPTDEEIEILALGDREPVLSMTGAVTVVSGRVVLVAEVALPGTLHQLEDAYDV